MFITDYADVCILIKGIVKKATTNYADFNDCLDGLI